MTTAQAGMGMYQYIMLILCGIGNASDAIEVATVRQYLFARFTSFDFYISQMSFAVTTTAECDLGLDNSEKV